MVLGYLNFLGGAKMNRKTIADTLRKKRHNLKQVREALKLVDDLGWRIGWAQDFSELSDINDALDPISSALTDAEDELGELEQHLEEQLQEYKNRVHMAQAEIAQEVLT
jgi:DNA-binding transcriptional MerR regulator